MAARLDDSVQVSARVSRRSNEKMSRGSVSFQPKPSVYSVSGSGSEYYYTGDTRKEVDEYDTLFQYTWWLWLTEDNKARQCFRVLSLANLILLLLSLPFYDVSDGNNSNKLRIQFIVISVLDMILSLLCTFHLIVRGRYFIYRHITIDEETNESHFNYTELIRLLTLVGVSISLWYSVGIGVYRSIFIDISWYWYIAMLPRAFLSVTSSIKLFIPSNVESSVLQKVSTIIKWKQLCMVTLFYFIFVFIFALLGVHIIGGLDYICVYNNSVPAIPIRHCDINNPSGQGLCNNDSDYLITCERFSPNPDFNEPIFINYRTFVYYGQFRTILDGLYAVYEASTLELWSFMMLAAFDARDFVIVAIYYTLLILFLVIILQQSIFLVVIIESFADLRSNTQSQQQINIKQTKTRPSVVLSLDSGSSVLRLKSTDTNSPKDFIVKYGKKLIIMEKFFLFLVFADAIVTSLKRAEYSETNKEQWKLALQIWQVTVSLAFLFEVIILFLFYLYHGQYKLFFKRPYYISLIILSIGGLVASIPSRYTYNPLYPSNGLILFQSLRFPRLIRVSRYLKDFFNKLLGNARIPILIAVTAAMIVFISIVNCQIFTYKDTECPNVGTEHYSNFIAGLSATFQLVMNEAWTDITSELMCDTNFRWIITNLYFIIIHLFSSLIFLNFFGAVILDNLEYSEEEKQSKLEDIKRKEDKSNTVPFHLRIFKKLNNQPKRLRPPGKGLPDPNLDEVDVRRFFESASQNVVPSPDPGYHDDTPPIPSVRETNNGRTQVRQYSLVSNLDEDDYASYTHTIEKKYQTIDSLLKFVKFWRRRVEANDVSSSERRYQLPDLFGDNKKQNNRINNNNNRRSEYDVYSERHRFFDMALFCMSPEHKLRRICTLILTAQAVTPKYELLEGRSLWELFKSRISFGMRLVLSQMPYSTWIMFIVLWATVAVQISESIYFLTVKEYYNYILPMECIYVLIMFLWLMCRVLSKGLFINPHPAIGSIWDILDWIFLIDSLLLLVLVPVWGTVYISSAATIQFNSYTDLSTWVSVMMGIRALRPLHIVSLFRSLRAVIREILEGWKNLLIAAVIMFGFMFMVASLGVQLFAGTDKNPLAYCNDPVMTNRSSCVGEFYISVRRSREFLHLPNVTGTNSILVPRVWFPYSRDYPFHNVLATLITLFELLTLEGWTEVNNLFEGRENDTSAWYMHFYIHIYIFLAVNLGLQLFLGVVVNNFNEHKPGHRFLLSVDQNRWIELMQRISLQRPYKLPYEPRENVLRLRLYNFVSHSHYRIIPTVFTILTTLTLVLPWNGSDYVSTLVALNLVFNFYAIFEVVIKLLAFGPTYFRSWRNLFDLFLVGATIIYYIFVTVYFTGFFSDVKLSYIALSIAVLKCIAILLKYSAMLNLLITVVTTILRTIPLIQILLILLICYSCVGIILFGDLRKGEMLSYTWISFAGTGQSLSAIMRCLTGEDWYQILWDVALKEPYGMSEDSKFWSIFTAMVYFGSFIVVVPFILLNVFIAVLLENFSIFYNDDDTNLSLAVIKDFKKKWRHFDPQAKGHVKLSRIKLLLRSLDVQDYYTYNIGDDSQVIGRYSYNLTEDSLLLWEMEEELRREVSQSVKKATPEDDVIISFQDVLKMLAYRCEVIHSRLESHELVIRQELETTIQIDVAEMCILKWLKKHVAPIVKWNRRQTPAETIPTINQPSDSTPHNKRYQLFAIHNMQSQLLSQDGPWPRQASMDTEDEERLTSTEQYKHFNETVSLGIEDDSESDTDEALARTYTKMMSNRNPELEKGREDASQWLQLQYHWMDHVGKDPNYFDDCL